MYSTSLNYESNGMDNFSVLTENQRCTGRCRIAGADSSRTGSLTKPGGHLCAQIEAFSGRPGVHRRSIWRETVEMNRILTFLSILGWILIIYWGVPI
jgi:hypothetical protein